MIRTEPLIFDISKKWILYAIVIGSFIIIPSLAKAQMFSVKNPHQSRSAIPHFHIYIGAGPAHFNYRPNDHKGVHAFDGEIARLVIEAYNFKLFFKKGIGLSETSYFETGIQGGYGIQIYRNRHIRLTVPLQLRAAIMTVANDKHALGPTVIPSFKEGTINLRTGLDLKARLSSQFRVGASVIPNAGLTYSTGRYSGGGNVLGLTGEVRLFFDHLFGNAGLSVGYHYGFRKFNIKGNRFDYNLIENAFVIGITF